MYLDEFEYIDERVGKCVLPPQDYIRTIFSLKLPYYDTKKFQIAYKTRAWLIIGCENSRFHCDHTYLFQNYL